MTPNVKPASKKQRIMDFIKSKGPAGAYFSEIQRFVVEMNGLNYDEKQVTNPWQVNNGEAPRYARKYRGYYCDYFYGSGFFNGGFFSTFCVRMSEGSRRARYALKKEFA